MANERSGKSRELVIAEKEKGLGAQQRAALEMLRLGKSMSETARATGVSRMSVYRWLRRDPAFLAAYNQWQDETEESCRSRLTMLTDKATDALEKALEAGDAKLALQLLKGMGFLRAAAQTKRPTDAEEVRRRGVIDEKRRVAELERDERRVVQQDKKWRYSDEEFEKGLAEATRESENPNRVKTTVFEVVE